MTSTFEYFPGVPIYQSKDLVHWRLIGHCLTRPSQADLRDARSSDGIYAPTVRHHSSGFYVTTTNVTRGGSFLVHASTPSGKWSDPIWVDQEGIDPSLLFDQDGKVYFTSALEDGIVQSEIDVTTGAKLSPTRFLWQGTGGQFPEGPHLYRIGDWYYLLLAEGGTEYGHMVTIGRSKSPWGPFESCPQNPILTHRSRASAFQATGHGDLVQAIDRSWWMVFLGIRPHGYPPVHHLGRETFLAPVRWTADGWPIVADGNLVPPEMPAPNLPPVPLVKEPLRDEFDAAMLRPCWNFLRNPNAESWSLASRPGWLTLFGSELTLNEVGSPAFVGRRQQHFDCAATGLLDFTPSKEGEEAGLTVRMNEAHHYEIAVTRQEGEACVVVRRRIGGLVAVVAKQRIGPGPYQLGIQAERDQYVFQFGLPGEAIRPLASGETRYLSTEVAGGFTGVYLGMYSTGNGRRSTTPARFDWFEYGPVEEPNGALQRPNLPG